MSKVHTPYSERKKTLEGLVSVSYKPFRTSQLFYQPLLFCGKILNPPPSWENLEIQTPPLKRVEGESSIYVLGAEESPVLLWSVSTRYYACYVRHIKKCLFLKFLGIDEFFVIVLHGENPNFTFDVWVHTIITFQGAYVPMSALADYYCTFIQHIGPSTSRDFYLFI